MRYTGLLDIGGLVKLVGKYVVTIRLLLIIMESALSDPYLVLLDLIY